MDLRLGGELTERPKITSLLYSTSWHTILALYGIRRPAVCLAGSFFVSQPWKDRKIYD